MKQITISDENGNKYTLEFSKQTIIQMEKAGFNADEFERQPVTMATLLVQGAFAKHHKLLPAQQIEAIYNNQKDKPGLLARLGEMYAEHVNELVGEGNAEWEANW